MSAILLAGTISAAEQTEWHDPAVNAINRAPMHTNYFAYPDAEEAAGCRTESSNYMSINGLWKFNWVKDADMRPSDFYLTGFNDKGWDQIPVPGIWELNGYGDPLYNNVGYAWQYQFRNNPPEVPVKNNHVGSYRREITIPADWNGKQILAHFGSVSSNMYLWVNGKFVGYSEDTKLEAEFDITKYVKPGKNLIAFQVFRWCDGSYFEDQDFMRYSGVARDCYLYSREKVRIQDIRITPDLDSNYDNGSLDITDRCRRQQSGRAAGYRQERDTECNHGSGLSVKMDGRNTISLYSHGNFFSQRSYRSNSCKSGIQESRDEKRTGPRKRTAGPFQRSEQA